MKTTKAISTITYNTLPFLDLKLAELVKNNIIDFYFYVFHYGETNMQTGEIEKNHVHLYMRPCKQVETNDFKSYFAEKDENSDKPLTCLPIEKVYSNYDAYYYFIHDSDYLASKNLQRQYHYTFNDVKTNDVDYLKEFVALLPIPQNARYKQIKSLIIDGATDVDLLDCGLVTLKSYAYMKSAFATIRQNIYSKNPYSKDENENSKK